MCTTSKNHQIQFITIQLNIAELKYYYISKNKIAG